MVGMALARFRVLGPAMLAVAGATCAAAPQGMGWHLEAGQVLDSSVRTSMLALGWQSAQTHHFWDGRFGLHWELYASRWRTEPDAGGARDFTQLGLVPMLRYRFARGASPWFIDGGVGLSYLTARYRNRVKVFGSQWNFSDHLGLGRSFGVARQHELGLYVKHVSNAGLQTPNPGETFVQLRYAQRF